MKKFFKAYVKNAKVTWSIIPSSKRLVNSMLKHIDFSKDIIIVEFWAWLWTFTKIILEKASSKSQVFAFEINDDFIFELNKINDPRLKIINDWAQNIWSYFKEEEVDVIVSWLPFWSLWKKFCIEVLEEAYKVLIKNWLYLQFQYFLTNLKEIKSIFKNKKIFFEPINIPPAFIYKCHK